MRQLSADSNWVPVKFLLKMKGIWSDTALSEISWISHWIIIKNEMDLAWGTSSRVLMDFPRNSNQKMERTWSEADHSRFSWMSYWTLIEKWKRFCFKHVMSKAPHRRFELMSYWILFENVRDWSDAAHKGFYCMSNWFLIESARDFVSGTSS